jgi:single-strand DNA-binding protein
MSNGMNKVFLLGNLGKPPELTIMEGGHKRLRLRLATNERYRDQNEQWHERTEWHDVTLWGNRGEALAQFLGTGDRVMIEGRIHNSSYEKDGVTRYRSEVVARDIVLAGRRSERVDVDVDDSAMRELIAGRPAAHAAAAAS